jgi:hypothetical protein
VTDCARVQARVRLVPRPPSGAHRSRRAPVHRLH